MSLRASTAVLCLVLFGFVFSRPTAYDAIYNVTYTGTLSARGTVEYFQGIHYALDTSGERRFAPPQPALDPVLGTVIDASRRGPICPQPMVAVSPFFNKPDEISENCLSLHIARPANLDSIHEAKLPVLAWVFTGGGMYGSGSDEHTNPENLIELSVEVDSPVIFVGINYRVGIFGFPSADILKEQKSTNLGMRDQRLALEWIKQNIAAFGGDPDRVTAYGHSAGGTFTALQQLSYRGEKGVPFDQAFLMSGPTGTAINQTRGAVAVNTANVASLLKCPATGQDMLDCMRKVPMQEMVEVSYRYAQEVHPPLGFFIFGADSDGDFLVDRPSRLLHDGDFVKGIPTILAWTEDEGSMLTGPAPLIQNQDDIWTVLANWNGQFLSEEEKAGLLQVYPAAEFVERAAIYNAGKPSDGPSLTPYYYQISSFLRDMLFACGSIDQTYHMQKHSQLSNKDFDSYWLYQLNQTVLDALFHSMGMDYIGATHGSDLNYVFNGVFPEGVMSESDLELARKLTASIISFANTGSPVSRHGFSSWPKAYDGVADINTQEGVMPSEINILSVGGPHGTNPVRISHAAEIAADTEGDTGSHESSIYNTLAQGVDDMQQVVLGAMKSKNKVLSQQALEKQKLFRRCSYVNSIRDSLDG